MSTPNNTNSDSQSSSSTRSSIDTSKLSDLTQVMERNKKILNAMEIANNLPKVPLKISQDVLDALTSPLKMVPESTLRLVEELQKFSRPTWMESQMSAALESARKSAKSFALMMGSSVAISAELAEQMSKMFALQDEQTRSITLNTAAILARNNIGLEDILTSASKSFNEAFAVREQDTNDKQINVPAQEIESVQNILNDPSVLLSEQQRSNFIKLIQAYPILTIIILFIIIPTLHDIRSAMVTNQVNNFLERTPIHSSMPERQELKAKINIARSAIGPNTEPFRVVNGRGVRVREAPSAKSAILGTLEYAQLVTIIEKYRSWAYVMYVSEDGDEHYGWMFSRYLQRLEKR